MAICTAKSSRTGNPCTKHAIAGGTVCRNHGGGAPQVKAKAKERLLALVDPALAVLARFTKVGSSAPESVQLRAATEILDRAQIDLENKSEQAAREITVRFVRPGQET